MAAPLENDLRSRTGVRWFVSTTAAKVVSGAEEMASGARSPAAQGCGSPAHRGPGRRPMSPPRHGRLGSLGKSLRLVGELQISRSAPLLLLPPMESKERGTSSASHTRGGRPGTQVLSAEAMAQEFSAIDTMIHECRTGTRRPESGQLDAEEPRMPPPPREARPEKEQPHWKPKKKYGPHLTVELKLKQRRESLDGKGLARAMSTNHFGALAHVPMCQHRVQGKDGIPENHMLVDPKALRGQCKIPMDDGRHPSVKELVDMRERQERLRLEEKERLRQRRERQRLERLEQERLRELERQHRRELQEQLCRSHYSSSRTFSLPALPHRDPREEEAGAAPRGEGSQSAAFCSTGGGLLLPPV